MSIVELQSRFDFIDIISQRIYGEIYKVSEKTSGKIFALKMFKLDHVYGAFSPILREVFILGKAKHNNIVTVHGRFIGVFENKKYICLLLDFYSKTLTDHCFGKRLDKSYALGLFQQLLDALCYLEDLGFHHCDLSFENIMIDEVGDIKLIDFGSCQRVNRRYNDQYIPTVYIRPPELFRRGCAVFSDKIDSWSLGMIYYFMLTGELTVMQKFEDEEEYYNKMMCALDQDLLMLDPNSSEKNLVNLLLTTDPIKRPNLSELSTYLNKSDALKDNEDKVTDSLDKEELTDLRKYLESFKFDDEAIKITLKYARENKINGESKLIERNILIAFLMHNMISEDCIAFEAVLKTIKNSLSGREVLDPETVKDQLLNLLVEKIDLRI